MSVLNAGARLREAALFQLLVLAGCNGLLGFDDFSVTHDGHAALAGECSTNQQCRDRATRAHGDFDAGEDEVAAVCVRPEQRCVELLTEDCTLVTGPYLEEGAIVIGSLFSTTGAQSATNLARQASAALAIEELNAAGGIPRANTSGHARSLVMVSCDEAANLRRASEHLVNELHVPAIVGPNTSQDTLDVSSQLTIEHGTLVLSPTAVASSIADLRDNGLTFTMVPTDVQRAPLMIQQINALESRLRVERSRQRLKLGVIFRDDALGIGTRVSLNTLTFNGKPLSDPDNLGNNVRIDGYDFAAPDQSALVAAYAEFAPDIVVLAGTAEAVTAIMTPLEHAWTGAERPEYVLIDSVKVPELLAAVTDDASLRARVRGTGVTPSERSLPVFNAFKVDYKLRYPDGTATISGMGPAYDASYAIAYAIATLHDEYLSGATIANALRRLAGGSAEVAIGNTTILAAFSHLTAGDSVDAIGTFAPLHWDQAGAPLGGTLEVWCVGVSDGKPVYQSSGLTLELSGTQTRGVYTPCAE